MTSEASLWRAGQQIQTDVLLIDDSVSDLRVLMDMMNLKDLRISVALSGERGYQQAILLKPSLVLLDVRMPKMTGVELQAQMVKTGNRIPVIFMSGESLPHETLAAQQSNAVTFLWKPFRTEALLSAVNHGLELFDQLSD